MLKGIIGLVAGSALLFASVAGANEALTSQEQQMFLAAADTAQAADAGQKGAAKSAHHGKHHAKHHKHHRHHHQGKHHGKHHAKHHGKHHAKHHGKHHYKHHGKKHNRPGCKTNRCPVDAEMMETSSIKSYDNARMENYMVETFPEHR